MLTNVFELIVITCFCRSWPCWRRTRSCSTRPTLTATANWTQKSFYHSVTLKKTPKCWFQVCWNFTRGAAVIERPFNPPFPPPKFPLYNFCHNIFAVQHLKSLVSITLFWFYFVSFSYNGVCFRRFIFNCTINQYQSADSFWAIFLKQNAHFFIILF